MHRHVYPCGCEHGASCRNQSPRPHTWSGMYSDVRSDSRLSKPFFEMRFLRTWLGLGLGLGWGYGFLGQPRARLGARIKGPVWVRMRVTW